MEEILALLYGPVDLPVKENFKKEKVSCTVWMWYHTQHINQADGNSSLSDVDYCSPYILPHM